MSDDSPDPPAETTAADMTDEQLQQAIDEHFDAIDQLIDRMGQSASSTGTET